MARFAYTLLWWLALPALPLRLWWRGRAEPGYRQRIGERFGRYADIAAGDPQRRPLWIHAVSVGETRAAAVLIERLLHDDPQRAILLTHMTATGRETGRRLFGGRVTQAWLPYDFPFAMRRFLAHFRPRAGLIVETELWPNLMHEARRAGVPLWLVNARLSERSARGYAHIRALSRPMLEAFAGIAAQTGDDATRLRALGAGDVVVTGNLKFDVDPPAAVTAKGAALRARFGADRPLLVLASTRDGEEALFLDALSRAPAALPRDAVIVIVPRHPQRFDDVAALLRMRGLPCVRRSSDTPPPGNTRFVLGDSMGEMDAYYAAADVAFVAGSLLPLGSHNVIESIAAGVPTLVGPHTFNFAQAADDAIAAGAAIRVADADDLVRTAGALMADPAVRREMHLRALAFSAAHRGAVDRLWEWLAPQIAAVSLAGGG